MWRLDKKNEGSDILTESADGADFAVPAQPQQPGNLQRSAVQQPANLHGSTATAAALRPAPQAGPQSAPNAVTTGDPTVSPANIAEPVWQSWRDELAQVGGASPLLHFVDRPRTRIELSTTHPGGLPQFITGHSVLLSSLIRDELALRNARVAANAICAKGVELR